MDGVVIFNPDVERKMKEAMAMLNETLQGKDYQTLVDYSKDVRDGKIPIDSCPNFSNSAGGVRKKGRRLTKKKGGVGKGRRADGADATDSQDSSMAPDFASGTTMTPVNEWDSYDYAAAAYIIVAGGGIQYLGGMSVLFNAAADAIAQVGGIPSQEEACAPINVLKNAQLGRVMTGMMSCEDVQKRYVAIVMTMVSTLGLCIYSVVSSRVKEEFANVNWKDLGQVVTALGSAGHAIVANGLRRQASLLPPINPITGICNQLRKIINYWGAAGSKNAVLSEGAGSSSSAAEGPILSDGVSPLVCGDGSGSSGGRRRRRQTKKRRKQKGKRKYKTKKR